ncbi:MAG: pyrroline-5-carboxylate reductase [Chloroflexi bacterium]|nr:pyrroline-5-carboxylate reductase [Chloroflexota bacterium]
MKIAFIGGGIMAEAMIKGILHSKVISSDNIFVSDISTKRLDSLNNQYNIKVSANNRETIKNAEIIVLAIKPQVLHIIFKELAGLINPDQLIISIIAGANIAKISEGLKHQLIVRAMPNMPAQIGEGISVWTASETVDELKKTIARRIIGSLGTEIFVDDEKYLNMATAVSGSGPAYIFLIMETFVDAAVHIGFSREIAEKLVLQTFIGSAKFMEISKIHPAQLRNMVTSPGGTTTEGILVLEEGSIRALIMKAIVAGYEKANKLGS